MSLVFSNNNAANATSSISILSEALRQAGCSLALNFQKKVDIILSSVYGTIAPVANSMCLVPVRLTDDYCGHWQRRHRTTAPNAAGYGAGSTVLSVRGNGRAYCLLKPRKLKLMVRSRCCLLYNRMTAEMKFPQ